MRVGQLRLRAPVLAKLKRVAEEAVNVERCEENGGVEREQLRA